MLPRFLAAARGSLAALVIVASATLGFVPSASAEDAKPADKPAGQEPAKEPQRADEYAEAQKEINGPAGNPECVWLGSRVVSLLLRDDLDTAFRHLDLYDRFGCPSGHVQAAFRCLVLHQPTISADPKSADPKSADSLNGRVHACWINPSMQAAAAPAPSSPAAAAASQTSTH